jgi:hypothetical protein
MGGIDLCKYYRSGMREPAIGSDGSDIVALDCETK